MASIHAYPHAAANAVTARLAGICYLIIICSGVSAEMLLRAPLQSATIETFGAVYRANPFAFRLSLLADLTMVAADVTLALLFFMLLRSVNEFLAIAVLVFRLVQAVLVAGSLVLLTAIPPLIQGGNSELAFLFLGLHGTGYDVGLVFFGINSLLMWKLLRASGRVPRLIAAGIGFSGMVYITGSLLRLNVPEAYGLFEPAYLLPLVAETALCLWLLIKARV